MKYLVLCACLFVCNYTLAQVDTTTLRQDVRQSEMLNANLFIGDVTDENQPLYIYFIEGVAYEDTELTGKALQQINLNDIDAISIITGDDAFDTYGEKGKNGVIEVSLKNEKVTDKQYLKKWKG